jgi:hypothetical protein
MKKPGYNYRIKCGDHTSVFILIGLAFCAISPPDSGLTEFWLCFVNVSLRRTKLRLGFRRKKNENYGSQTLMTLATHGLSRLA